MADKKFNFTFSSGEVMYTSIRKSSSGYNYASVGVKRGDNEYINIDYEWQGKDVPDFAMDMLGFMQANKQEIAEVTKDLSAECASFLDRVVESK